MKADKPSDDLIGRGFHALRSAFAGIALISLPINILMLTGPLYMLQIYDRVLASNSVPTLLMLSGLAIVLFLSYGLLEGIRSRVLLRIAQRLDIQLSTTCYAAAVEAPMARGKSRSEDNPVHDLETVRQFLSGPGASAIFDMPWIPVYLAIVYLLHPVLGIVATVGAIVIITLIGLNELLSRASTLEAGQYALRRAQTLEQGRRNAEVISALGMTENLKLLWASGNRDYLGKQRQAIDRNGLFVAAIKTFRLLLQSAVLGVGAWLAIRQVVSPGVMIAAAIITSRALSPIEQAIGQWRSFVSSRQCLARLRGLNCAVSSETRTELPLPRDRLTVENVFAGPAEKPLLQSVSFQLEAGEGLGIIGPSGAGKTTLARTLMGVYPIVQGSLRLDGADMDQWDSRRRGSFLGYLPQDIQLFAGTVGQNVSRFDADASSDAIMEAARLVNAHTMITGLTDGYDAQIGPSGGALSRGQIQRIALARAFYKKPFLILLDEPNSNLDSDGDMALTQAIVRLREAGSIVIVIAHRPSGIAGVNKVLCLHNGRVKAFGAKDDVLKQVLSPVRAKKIATQ